MIKKHKFKKTKKEEIDRAREELKGLEDLPLVGGLVKGLEKFVDLAERVEEAGGKIERKGEIRGLGGRKGIRGIYGFSIKTGISPKGKPRIQTFGNIKETKKGPKIMETREPIVDVFDEKDHILIVAEMPGLSKEDIKLDLKGDILILGASNGKSKFTKEILLPSKIDIKTKKISYKNGIFELKLKKKKE